MAASDLVSDFCTSVLSFPLGLYIYIYIYILYTVNNMNKKDGVALSDESEVVSSQIIGTYK